MKQREYKQKKLKKKKKTNPEFSYYPRTHTLRALLFRGATNVALCVLVFVTKKDT